jgi:hypothetical protein
MENDKSSVLELTDKLVDFLEKQTPPGEVALKAVLHTLASTIASLSDPKAAMDWVSRELPRLVAIAERAVEEIEKRKH